MVERGKEFVSKKNWDLKQLALFWGVFALLIAGFVLLHKMWWMVAFLFVLLILCLYFMYNTFEAEYAYTISNKFTVEILKSSGKRVPVYECFFSDITFVGRYNAENRKRFDNADEVYKAATDVKDDVETYGALIERNGKRTVVLFTPNDMMLGEMKKHSDCVTE